MYITSVTTSLLYNVTFRNHDASRVMIKANVPLTWRCHLGQWMGPINELDGVDFNGCLGSCPVGSIGERDDLTSADECTPCPTGHHCNVTGLSAGIPCPVGTVKPTLGGRSQADCLECPAGQYNNRTGEEECRLCPAKSFAALPGAPDCTVCSACGIGQFETEQCTALQDTQCTQVPLPPSPPPQPPPPTVETSREWERINCPVMSAVVKNEDLVPDIYGMVSKQETFEALMRVGISEKVARETTDANFDHLQVKQINVFRMNTHKASGQPDAPGALEHFRSTGIRDGLTPNAEKYQAYEACAAYDVRFGGSADELSTRDIEECANLVWDHERFEGFAAKPNSLPAELESNDVLEAKRPAKCPKTASGLSGCDPQCSASDCPRDVAPCCRSQLHGAINFMHQELGTPTGPNAVMSVTDSSNAWLHGTYPPPFAARSPRHCVNASDPTVAGCDACLRLIPSNAYGLVVIAATSSEANRYCRCLLSKRPHVGTHALRVRLPLSLAWRPASHSKPPALTSPGAARVQPLQVS